MHPYPIYPYRKVGGLKDILIEAVFRIYTANNSKRNCMWPGADCRNKDRRVKIIEERKYGRRYRLPTDKIFIIEYNVCKARGQLVNTKQRNKNIIFLQVMLCDYFQFSHRKRKKHCNQLYIYCERSEASSQSEPRFTKARELLFNVWGLEQAVSRKLSIFDIWCIEEKMFVFT